MFRSIKQLYGDKLGATDGEIGQVKDFYFDDRNWAVRYVVADTGAWLPGRLVLLSPHAFGRLSQTGEVLDAKLTRKQIEDSPSIALHQPVSRQYEEEYHKYYGWPFDGLDAAPEDTGSFANPETPPGPLPRAPQARPADAHLRSTQAVNGYQLRTSDGTIGHVCDFMMNDQSWTIAHLVIKTGHRLNGKEVQIPASQVQRISHAESTVFVNLTSKSVEQSPEQSPVPNGSLG